MDYSPPGFSVHGRLQARILEWVTISFSRRSSWTQRWNPCLLHWQLRFPEPSGKPINQLSYSQSKNKFKKKCLKSVSFRRPPTFSCMADHPPSSVYWSNIEFQQKYLLVSMARVCWHACFLKANHWRQGAPSPHLCHSRPWSQTWRAACASECWWPDAWIQCLPQLEREA